MLSNSENFEEDLNGNEDSEDVTTPKLEERPVIKKISTGSRQLSLDRRMRFIGIKRDSY